MNEISGSSIKGEEGDRGRQWRRLVLNPWLWVALGPWFLLGPRLAQGKVFFWGTPLLQFIPWRAYGFEILAEGFLPLWNPLLGMGAPLLANYQSAFFYPLNGILLLVDTAWGHGLLVLAHLLLAGGGMVALTRRLGFSDLAATIAGLSFSLSAYLVSRSGFFSINAAAAWLPWILWSFEGWRRASGWELRDFLPAVAFLWLQWLAGHAQTAWYTLILLLAWLIWGLFTEDERISLGSILRLAAPFALAFLLAAPQLLPTMEYLINSQRAASVDPELALTYSFWPWRLLELILPGVFGHPASGDYWGYANYWEDALYLGALPLLLAIGGAIASLRRRTAHWKLGRFLILVSAVSFLLSLGKNTPVFPWLMQNVPTFNLFQAPTRWNLLVTAGLPLLAAIGLDAWKPAEGRALYWLRLGTAGAAAITGGAWLASQLLPEVRETFLEAFAWAGLWLMLAGALGLLLKRRKPEWWWIAVSIVVLADLLVATHGLIPMTEASLYQGSSRLADEVGDEGRVYLDPQVEYSYTFNQAFRFDSFVALEDWFQVRQAGLPNTPLLDRVNSANNFDPLLPGRFQRWMEWLPSLPPGKQAELRGLMDVIYFSNQMGEDGLPVYQEQHEAARLRWLTQAEMVDGGEAALARMADPDFDPEKTILVEGSQAPSVQQGASATISLLATEQGPNRLTINVEAEGSGWLLLSDTYFPGWRATIDQQRTKIWRADYLFRAVHVPTGSHTIEFVYQPISIRIGFALFGIGALILLGFWVSERWR